MSFVFTPPATVSVPVVGTKDRFPVHRIYCVGRNYEEHAKEMGFTGRFKKEKRWLAAGKPHFLGVLFVVAAHAVNTVNRKAVFGTNNGYRHCGGRGKYKTHGNLSS